ncbi:DinB family protein [Zavarzinia sp. CC-PAN008]|uniref:DinB family protein n=1 Tax=Zavarzinia sp. CC-PAN008 TaxID=3243332 RepID=UPI003F749BC0
MQPYAQMIDVKRWADRSLCAAIARDIVPRGGDSLGLMLRLLDHIHAVDVIFQHHLLGRPHGFSAARSETLPSLEDLSAGLDAGGAWYAAYASALTPDQATQAVDFVFTSGKPARMTRGQILLHVCLHGTYHRGNAGALLQLNGLTPGRDSLTDHLEEVGWAA